MYSLNKQKSVQNVNKMFEIRSQNNCKKAVNRLLKCAVNDDEYRKADIHSYNKD